MRRTGGRLANDAERIAIGEDWRMEVSDETGVILLRLDLTIIESPVIRRVCDEEGRIPPSDAGEAA